MKFAPIAAMAALLLSSAAQAQSVSANNPAAMMRVLQGAGYAPKLDKDSYGDPTIEFELAGYDTSLLFYGCDEDTHDQCDSVQLRAGFDRETPWTADKILEVSKKYRFASVWLDDDGDPWVQWDIMTGTGIPAAVFLSSVEVFGDTLEDTADMVFADD